MGRTIGIVLETRDDAQSLGANLDTLYHWREPEEIESIISAIHSIGFIPVLLGTPADFCNQQVDGVKKIDFVLNLSVGFKTRYRLSLGPSLYELKGLAYSGADPYTKMVSQNKHLMKSFWLKQGIPTPEWTYLHSENDLKNAVFPEFPLIIKPAYEGSSIGVNPDSLVHSEEQLNKRVIELFRTLKIPVIAERFIIGNEYKVGIIGNEIIKFIGLIEDVDTNGNSLGEDFIYYNAKTEGFFDKKSCDINEPGFLRLREDCLMIYRYFMPVDYGTFDIRVDQNGNHYFLEFNADATLHPRRTLARCCDLHGVAFETMIRMILETSFERWGIKWT